MSQLKLNQEDPDMHEEFLPCTKLRSVKHVYTVHSARKTDGSDVELTFSEGLRICLQEFCLVS